MANKPEVEPLDSGTAKVVRDLMSWTELSDKSGVPRNLLSQWYRRNHFGLKDSAVRPDMSPPLFLWSRTGPLVKAAKRASR